jgi:hypothetical protein
MRICKVCKVEKSLDNFSGCKTICKTCFNKQLREIRGTPDGYRKHIESNKKSRESSFKSYLSRKLLSIKGDDKKTNRENNLDVEYLLGLLELQNECCAGTGIKMTHKMNDLRAVSIDRIDSTKGHIKGNVQLVCRFYNIGKSNKSDGEAKSIITEIQLNLLKRLRETGHI